MDGWAHAAAVHSGEGAGAGPDAGEAEACGERVCEPLKKFPKTISAAEQKRITTELLDVIGTDVLPSYQRFAKFMVAQYIPKGRKDPGAWALPDGDAYYAWRIRQSTTLNKSAAEIHQIGLDEVARDEAEMLAIVQEAGLQRFEELQRGAEDESEAASDVEGAVAGLVPRLYRPDETEAAGAFWHAAEGAVGGGGMPAFIEKDQAAAYYDQGSADGKRPGHVWM